MHNIDRTQPEMCETYEYGPTEFGYESGETGSYGETEAYGEFGYESGETGNYGGVIQSYSPLS